MVSVSKCGWTYLIYTLNIPHEMKKMKEKQTKQKHTQNIPENPSTKVVLYTYG